MSNFKRGDIKKLLKDYDEQNADIFDSYCVKLLIQKDKQKKLKNPWMQNKKAEDLAELFKRVHKQGLVFDGKNITLQYTGICFNYQAYKNKMYIAYPESKIDVQLVKEGDKFSFSKESGCINYTHEMSSIFDNKNVIGAYCVIKNRRGEFLVPLNKEDLLKRRKKSKMDSIWNEWEEEMMLKSVIKRACNLHFDDVIQDIEDMDNDNYDLDNPVDLDLLWKQEIDSFTDIDEFIKYFNDNKNKGRGKEFELYAIKHGKKLREQVYENS